MIHKKQGNGDLSQRRHAEGMIEEQSKKEI